MCPQSRRTLKAGQLVHVSRRVMSLWAKQWNDNKRPLPRNVCADAGADSRFRQEADGGALLTAGHTTKAPSQVLKADTGWRQPCKEQLIEPVWHGLVPTWSALLFTKTSASGYWLGKETGTVNSHNAKSTGLLSRALTSWGGCQLLSTKPLKGWPVWGRRAQRARGGEPESCAPRPWTCIL